MWIGRVVVLPGENFTPGSDVENHSPVICDVGGRREGHPADELARQ